MTALPRRALPLLVLLAALAAPAAAQERGDPTRIFLGLGVASAANGKDGEGIGVLVQLAWQKGPHHVALRGVGVASPFDPSSEAIAEVGVLYGRTRSSAWGHATMAAGVAATDAGVCEPAGCQATTVGVPLVLEAALEPSDLFGLGLQLFGNINPHAFYGGLSLHVQLGWMP